MRAAIIDCYYDRPLCQCHYMKWNMVYDKQKTKMTDRPTDQPTTLANSMKGKNQFLFVCHCCHCTMYILHCSILLYNFIIYLYFFAFHHTKRVLCTHLVSVCSCSLYMCLLILYLCTIWTLNTNIKITQFTLNYISRYKGLKAECMTQWPNAIIETRLKKNWVKYQMKKRRRSGMKREKREKSVTAQKL